MIDSKKLHAAREAAISSIKDIVQKHGAKTGWELDERGNKRVLKVLFREKVAFEADIRDDSIIGDEGYGKLACVQVRAYKKGSRGYALVKELVAACFYHDRAWQDALPMRPCDVGQCDGKPTRGYIVPRMIDYTGDGYSTGTVKIDDFFSICNHEPSVETLFTVACTHDSFPCLGTYCVL